MRKDEENNKCLCARMYVQCISLCTYVCVYTERDRDRA